LNFGFSTKISFWNDKICFEVFINLNFKWKYFTLKFKRSWKFISPWPISRRKVLFQRNSILFQMPQAIGFQQRQEKVIEFEFFDDDSVLFRDVVRTSWISWRSWISQSFQLIYVSASVRRPLLHLSQRSILFQNIFFRVKKKIPFLSLVEALPIELEELDLAFIGSVLKIQIWILLTHRAGDPHFQLSRESETIERCPWWRIRFKLFWKRGSINNPFRKKLTVKLIQYHWKLLEFGAWKLCKKVYWIS